ncbi:MAG: glycosyltransferase [Cyclobacteriaceae bacterium]|nr:glycosyltransferase [Cyclobacteriaceae bacterium]
MTIVYLGYWGANDGLSQATINPHLSTLQSMDSVDKVIYVSVERERVSHYELPPLGKVIHRPFVSKSTPVRIITKFLDIVNMRHHLLKIIGDENADLMICRSSLAGAIGFLVHRKCGIPYVVESFEPHAHYMREIGEWRRFGVSYILQSYWEKMQKNTARMLVPVSHAYKNKLMEEKVNPQKIEVLACGVDLKEFAFDKAKREKIRNEWELREDVVVGIYVGKLGGIYLDEWAGKIFRESFRFFPNFRLIILSPMSSLKWKKLLSAHSVPLQKTNIRHVMHWEIPTYLSAADFGYSLIKPSEYRKYCSPIKNGEYWANGLPILMPYGIGDDSAIIESNPSGGALFELKSPSIRNALSVVKTKIGNRHAIAELAHEYRDMRKVKDVYKRIVY